MATLKLYKQINTMAAQRLNSILIRSAIAGKLQIRSFQTIPYATSRFVHLEHTATKSLWANPGCLNTNNLQVMCNEILVL